MKTGTPDTTLQQANHTWDAGGNLTKREDLLPAQAETETFAYDFLDRLTSETNFLFKFGDTGPSSTVSTPWHAETNSSGNTWVADWGNYRIAEYTSTGQFVGSFGEQQLGSPTGVTRDGDGNFYVSDFWNDKIYKFTSTGNFAWEKGGYGSGNEQFKHPADVVFISSNNNAYIYVADQYNSRVQYFDTSGNYVGTIGGFGSANGQMKYPGGVGRDVQGNLYVADTVNQRIQKFTSDGTHLATFGGPPAGSGDGQFSAPRDVAVDSSGNIFVADTGNHRIQKLSPTGVFITKWGAQGSNPGQFDSPYGVNLASGRIYVVDYNNSRLQTFDLSTTTAWSYNPVGNMTSRDGLAYTYGSKPHAVTQAGSATYGYDANGNMTNRAGQTLTWDIENRLTAVTGGVSYVYDGDGFRVKKTEGGQTVLYAGKYYEKNLSTGTVTLYYYLGDKLVAYKEIPQQGSSTLRYIHQDHLTGTSLTTDSSGNSAGSIKYKPYGETRSSTSPLPAHKFTGQRLDDIGLYYYGARYYDPQLSRFVSLDPIMSKLKNPQGQNRYSYVANNPLKNIDPNGLDWIIVGGQNSTPDDYKFWYDHLKANDLLKPGEKVYFLPDTNPGLLVFTNVNVNPRFMDLIGLLYSPNDYTDIKIMGHSEGAATVGTLMAELADNPNILPESVRNQLRAVFLLETPTGLANLGVRNFNFFELSDLPRRLGNVRGGIIIADIYNSASKVHDMMIPGWEGNTYDVATLYQKMLAMYLSGNWGLFSLALTAIEHDAIKADAMKVIQNLLGTSGE